MTREEEIKEMAKIKASHITSDKDMQVAFADALRSGAEWADAHPHWISVDEELPKENGRCLVFNGVTKDQEIFVYSNGIWWHNAVRCPNGIITHWMPLPQAPMKGGNQ